MTGGEGVGTRARGRRPRAFALVVLFCGFPGALAGAPRNLEIYWIDAEGGAATLIVAPSGESLLVDSAKMTNLRNGFSKSYRAK